MKNLKRWISILCCIVLLPISAFPETAVGEEVREPQRWTQEQRNKTVHIQDDLVIDGKVVFTDGAELVMDAGNLYITPEAVFIGNIWIIGNDVAVDIGGKVIGHVYISGTSVHAEIAGQINGMLSVSNFVGMGKEEEGAQLRILKDAIIETLYLDGKGHVWSQGHIDLLDTSASNEISVDVEEGYVDIFYARSNIQYTFSYSTVNTLIMNMDRKMPLPYEGPNVGFYGQSHLHNAVVHSGLLDIYFGTSVDEVYLEGDSTIHIDLAWFPDKETPAEEVPWCLWLPTVEKVFLQGEKTNCINRGYIGCANIQQGSVLNAGQIETLVLQSATLSNYYGGRFGTDFEAENYLRDVFELYFDHHIGTMYAYNSTVYSNEGSIFQRIFLDNSDLSSFNGITDTMVVGGYNTRGTIGDSAVIKNFALAGQHELNIYSNNIGKLSAEDFPSESEAAAHAIPIKGGESEKAAVTLGSGIYEVAGQRGSAYFKIPCDAYSSLNLTFEALGGYGCAVIRTPDGKYTLLDPSEGNNVCSLFVEEAGDCQIRLLGTSNIAKYILQTEVLAPVRLDFTVTEYTAQDDANEMAARTCELDDVSFQLFNVTQNQVMEAVSVTENALYCLPDQAQPGDEIQILVSSGNDTVSDANTTVKLSQERFASASIELREKGRYRAVPKDDTRARCYLYDENGNFLKEVFPSLQGYDTGAMDEGTYYAVWIRGGIGAWKLLHLNDFTANALIAGTHYLLEKIVISDGTILRATPEIPEEPRLQSPYLSAEGTGYEARKSAVVRGDMVLFSLQWELTEKSEGIEAAQIAFLSGTSYIEGSAVLENGMAQDVVWKNNVLSVPLSSRSGKLMFYMEAVEDEAAMISNASLLVNTGEGIKSQYIGSAQVKVSKLSISGPTLTSGNEVLISGYAAPYSQLAILDQGRRVTSAVAGARGQWSALVPLTNEKTHSITAQTEDGLLTAPVTVRRAAGAPRLKEFLLDYEEHGVFKQVRVSGEAFGKSEIRFAYLPGSDLTFTLTLENDALLKEVTLVAFMDSVRFELPAVNMGNGRWVARGQFSSDDMFAPDRYTIEYSFREDALREAFREPYVEVPLMRTLVSADDLTSLLPLARYYMASPSMQTIDRGFGPGWLTNYDIYAVVTGEGNARQLIVWSPAQTRVFTPNGKNFAEVGGYGKATVSQDGIVLEEQDGSALGFGADGRLAYIAGSSGYKISLTYDEDGRLLSVSTADISLNLTYDRDGKVISASCGDEAVLYTYERDALARVNGSEKQDVYSYDGLFTQGGLHPLTYATQDSETIRFRYNSQGFPAWMDVDGVQVWLEYSENSVSVMNGDGYTVTYTLNEAGGLSRMDASDGRSAQVIPLTDGTTRIVSTAQGQTAQLTLDGCGHILDQTDTDGLTVYYAYDDRGNLSAITDKAGRITRYETNSDGQTTKITYPDGSSKRYKYDQNGNLTQYTNQAGDITQLVYKNGNLVRVNWSDETHTDYEYYSDENGASSTFRQKGRWNSVWVDEYGYEYTLTDNARTQFKNSDENGYAILFNWQGTYNALNDDGDLTDVYGWGEDIHLLHIDYEEGAPVRETMANGVTTSYSWNEDPKVYRMENLSPDGSLLSFYEMELDEAGNVVRLTTAEGIWRCEYDAIGQLIRTEGPDGIVEYTYDNAGNRLSKTVNGERTEYTYDKMNRLLTANGVSYSYDKNGRLVKKQGDGEPTRYTWNAQNQLARVAQGNQITEYTYDLFGNRASMTQNGQTTYFYNLPTDLSQTLAMEDEDGLTVFYVGDAGLICAQHEEKKYYYTYTPLGSVSEITDEEGNVVAHYTYDLEGHVASEEILQEGLFENPFTYVGRYGVLDDGNGLWCARARFVDQNDLRFISPDPAEQEYDLNLYRYAANNTVENVDISGEKSLKTIGLELAMEKQLKMQAAKKVEKEISERAGKIEAEQSFIKTQGEMAADDYRVAEEFKRKQWEEFSQQMANNNMMLVKKKSGNSVLNKKSSNNVLKRKKGEGGYTTGQALMGLSIVGTTGTITGSELVRAFNDPKVEAALNTLKDVGGIALDVAPIILPILLKALAKAGLGAAAGSTGVGTAVTAIMWASTAKDIYDIGNIIKDVIEARQQNNGESGKQTLASSPAETKIDPSGYVYEAVASNLVEGVTATVYYQDDEGYPVLWQAEEYDETNPQVTDLLGQYGWDVPAGHWKVRFEKEGFETVETGWLPVPPPQTEVNVGMVCLQAPEIVFAVLHGDSLEFEFSRYMEPESVQGAVFVNGKQVNVQPLNVESASDDPARLLASRFLVNGMKDAESAALAVTGQAVSYAGVQAVPMKMTVQRVYGVDSIQLEPSYTFTAGQDAAIDLQVQGEGHFDTLRFSVETVSDGCVENVEISQPDVDGRITLFLHAEKIGTAALRVKEATNNKIFSTELTVVDPPSYLYQAVVETQSDAGISLWDSTNKGESYGKVPKGEIVQVLEEKDNGWVIAKYKDIEGYADTKYLKRIPQ